jgi:hypothetical protein
LIIAISDYPAATSLPGAAKDLADWTKLLNTLGFTVKPLANASAMKADILREFTTLLTKASAGDDLVLIYSGHGTRALAYDGLVGYFTSGTPNSSNTVLTKELKDIITSYLPAGAKLTTILDCCHAEAVLVPPSIAMFKKVGERGETALDQVRFLPYGSSADGFFRRLVDNIRSFTREALNAFGDRDEPLRLSATKKTKSAYEGKMADGEFHGYFSYSLTTSATASAAVKHDEAVLMAALFVSQYHSDQEPHIKGPRRSNPFLT